ncbi:aldolase [Paenibacillus sp. J5C_2022]|uniref:aldolase n=1 Tax=Paenibacillus sp. J5C2022 TaxID=2977129 RepID=UPI0021D3C75C|nr:aldolase [Paenibacillus sp. J5C2022]MCU6710282.1 aldolase [Paenibacillus sp. J5C2022]
MTVSNGLRPYYSFGLSIQSEIPMPELPLLEEGSAHAHGSVTITFDNLLPLWELADRSSQYVGMMKDMVLIRIPDTAIFGMEAGKRILVSPFQGADTDKIRLYLLGTCMGITLMQKRILPLHGSAVAIGGEAYAIVGHSGAGKTTLSSMLIQQGYPLLSDDLIAVMLDENGMPQAMPAYPQQKLWQETMDMLGRSADGLKPLFERENKFAVPLSDGFCLKPLPLAGVIELVKTENDAAISPVAGLERFHTLLQHTFRGFLLKRLGLMDWHFSLLASLMGRIGVYRLQRPVQGTSPQQLSSLLVDTIRKEVV